MPEVIDNKKGQEMMSTLLKILCVAGLLSSAVTSAAEAAGPTARLQARNVEFNEGVVKVTDNVYTAVGYGVSTASMIVGENGVIIVDTMIDVPAAERALVALRKYSDKPVKAIIFTHGHGDHTGGAGVFAAETKPQIWARAGFGEETRWLADAGLTYQRARGVRQAGFLLQPEERINNGIAKAYWPTTAEDAFSAKVSPTHTYSEKRKKIIVSGVRLELVAASGETGDQLYVWYPEQGVLFAGDNFYKSWPNLYAIRGTGYRDINAWIASLSMMINENPTHVVAGHTRPILGEANVAETLTAYRDAVRSVFEQTIAGMNQGLTPDELVAIVQLPDELSDLDYLGEYYGNIEWAVRAIFQGYLGWFDGNASNLFPLSPQEEAGHIAKLAGGPARLLHEATRALATGDLQWAAQLCDHLLALDPHDPKPKLIKADALSGLAQELLTATGRNYYLTSAKQLREEAEKER